MKGDDFKDLMGQNISEDHLRGLEEATERYNSMMRTRKTTEQAIEDALYGENSKSTNSHVHPSSNSGAQREALHIPYFRQVPLEAVAAGAAALEYGAKKYAHRNWERGLPWQQMIDSLKRHIDDFERREETDESGLHQVCMIMACAMMLSASVVRGIGEDDRMPAPAEEALSAKECAKWISNQLENVAWPNEKSK